VGPSSSPEQAREHSLRVRALVHEASLHLGAVSFAAVAGEGCPPARMRRTCWHHRKSGFRIPNPLRLPGNHRLGERFDRMARRDSSFRQTEPAQTYRHVMNAPHQLALV
jgi:hypothetical protein